MGNPFAHHNTVEAVTTDWWARRNKLDKWDDMHKRAELARHAANRWEQIRNGE